MARAYPKDLAALAAARWAEAARALVGEQGPWPAGHDAGPNLVVLEELLDACYQASLMREEERDVTFRLILADPEAFPPDGGPPSGFHRLVFPRAQPLEEDVLRRLSPAAGYHRSLIGVRETGDGGLEVWGLIHSGPGWVRATQGGRGRPAPLPSAPVVHGTGPGRVVVYRGDEELAGLRGEPSLAPERTSSPRGGYPRASRRLGRSSSNCTTRRTSRPPPRWIPGRLWTPT
jgi:hypothetical protein